MERAIDFVRQAEEKYFNFIEGMFGPDYRVIVLVLAAVLVVGAGLATVLRWREGSDWYWKNVIPFGRGKMSRRRARRNYVRRDAIDHLVHYVEEKVFHGEYARSEANELYRDARKYWPVKELFPSPVLLKENIKARLARGLNVPVPLPDITKKVKPKHAFDKKT